MKKNQAFRVKPLLIAFCFLLPAMFAHAQTANDPTAVPALVNFSGTLANVPRSELTGVTFCLYKDSQGGSPLWIETQNVQPDKNGHYTVMLGAATSGGIPTALFASGEARWLGVQAAGQSEQPRVMLLAVPYALKAADAQTVGGLPPSAFVLAAPSALAVNSPASTLSSSANLEPTIGGGGTTGYLAAWTDNNGDLGNSILYESGSGSNAKIGINEKNPLFTLDVNGQELVRGLLEMATTNYATKNKGYSSQPLNLESSAFSSSTSQYTLNHFQWQAEPVGNNTANPSATLNLLYGTDPAAPAETGLKLSSTGVFTFAAGQTFPGAGTITGITAGKDLIGGGVNGTVTLGLDTTKVPQLATANTFTANQTVNGSVTASGPVSGSSFQIGINLFAFGSYTAANAFLGFAGNSTTSGTVSTAVGYQALLSNTAGDTNTAIGANALHFNSNGSSNTATGASALYDNTVGIDNTASGASALQDNTTGNYNTATGAYALVLNTTASYNTADGFQALYSTTTGNYNAATGYQALFGNTTGVANTAMGGQTLFANTTGSYNTASGEGVLYSNTTGTANTAAGFAALFSNTIGTENTASGYQALYANNTGNYNTADGYQALESNLAGYSDTAVGVQALFSNTMGTIDTALGGGALYSNVNGEFNVAVGSTALYANSSGQGNTGVGVQALYTNTNGNDLTCIGFLCSAGADALENATAIGAHAVVGQSNALVLGGTGQYAVKVGIGTSTPTSVLTIARGAGHPVSDSWETYSSRRWKTNIQTLPDALAKVERLRGVTYDLKDSGKHEVGVIAEEVGAVVPEIVTWDKNGTDAQGVDYSRLTAVLIEAVKAQQTQIASLTSAAKTQRREAAAQREQIRQLRVQDALLLTQLTRLENNPRQLKQTGGSHIAKGDEQKVVASSQF